MDAKIKTTIVVCVLTIIGWLIYNIFLFLKGRNFYDEKDDTLPGCLGCFLMLGTLGAWAMISYIVFDCYSKSLGLVLLLADIPFVIFTSSRPRPK